MGFDWNSNLVKIIQRNIVVSTYTELGSSLMGIIPGSFGGLMDIIGMRRRTLLEVITLQV